MSKLILIGACTKGGVAGNNGTLPWSLPSDLKYFQQQTTGNAVLMGRKTFDSIGRPLANRQNYVLTSQLKNRGVNDFKGRQWQGINGVQAMSLCECKNQKRDIYAIGG
ncbi:dihydrofolate reductase [uncultured Thiomicrorhabdus sp.]